ncbi:VTT domain-containing protein [Streptomyces xanthii]|uniref:VTT domain-containing protein n=1 Tax=Streptomyces xanthii TaxID=2768069 RepID=A0A7H1B2U9_9ACTN|nr:VTT domain-containing protein [Streptomyces xanthii]
MRSVVDGAVLTVAGLYAVILLRAGATFAAGWFVGSGVRRSRFSERIPAARLERAERAIRRWGMPVVAVSFLTVGFQTAVNFVAGTLRMPLRRYLPALFVGGAAWATLYGLVGTGALAFLRWLFTRHTSWGVAGVVLLALAVCGVVLVRRRRRAAGPDAEPAAGEEPVAGETSDVGEESERR